VDCVNYLNITRAYIIHAYRCSRFGNTTVWNLPFAPIEWVHRNLVNCVHMHNFWKLFDVYLLDICKNNFAAASCWSEKLHSRDLSCEVENSFCAISSCCRPQMWKGDKWTVWMTWTLHVHKTYWSLGPPRQFVRRIRADSVKIGCNLSTDIRSSYYVHKVSFIAWPCR